MDQANILITAVRSLELPKLEITTNEQKLYLVDLSGFKSVYCFPQTPLEWKEVSITAHGFNLTWGTRFEIHVHQAIDAALSVEHVKRQA